MDDTEKYSVGVHETAESAYDHLSHSSGRQAVIDTARAMAEVTIPSVFPPEGYQAGDHIGGNNQSVGAYCVNNLAAKLMFMAMPPGRPMMRFEVILHRLQAEIEQDPELWSKIELALSQLEQAHRRRFQTTGLRSAYTGMFKLLLVAGNGLWKHIHLDRPTYHRPDKYVVQRDSTGQQLLVILKETLKLASLDNDVRDLVLAAHPEMDAVPEWEREAEIYSVCKLRVADSGEQTWCYWQEFEGEVIPGTEIETDFDHPPLYAAWLIPMYGEDWGRSYCEEYRGDLYTCETHSASLNDGAAAASLVLTFVKPGSRTSARQIREAQNLSVLAGDAEDLSSYKLDKGQDFQFVAQNLEQAIRRLGRAFLLYSSVQRDAERVTAEEVQTVAIELDQAMGGLFSELALSFQRVSVQRAVALHEDEDPDLPSLPKNIVQLGVVTGIDALGRSQEGVSLVRFGSSLQTIFGPEAVARGLSFPDFSRRLAAAEGIQPKGLVKDENTIRQEMAEEQQLQARQTLLEKGTGPLAGAAAKTVGEQLTQQPPQE